MNTSKILKYIVYAMLGVWGFISLCVLIGDDFSNYSMSHTMFVIIKGGALASLYACFKLADLLNNKGLLPNFSDKEDKWED